MNTNTVVKKASDLNTGDVLAGSGFVVTNGAWRGMYTPKNKVELEGHYPNRPVKRVQWNRNTTVSVVSV